MQAKVYSDLTMHRAAQLSYLKFTENDIKIWQVKNQTLEFPTVSQLLQMKYEANENI